MYILKLGKAQAIFDVIDGSFIQKTKMWQFNVLLLTYRKVASSDTTCLEAHAGFFQIAYEGNLDVAILSYPFDRIIMCAALAVIISR